MIKGKGGVNLNETVKLLKNHRSVREFDPSKDVTEEQVQAMIESAIAAPNWVNGQQVSIIEVRDQEKKAKFAEAAGRQRWIEEGPVFFIFCLDFYRAKLAAEKNGTTLQIVDDIEAIIIGSTDVGIALSHTINAAESMGLGTVPIGGIRRNPQVFIDTLELPEYVFPISGLVVGHPRNIPEQKPRLPLSATFHKEQYDAGIQCDVMDQYDEMISTYMKERTNGKSSANWSSRTAGFYDSGFEHYQKNVTPALRKQGFRYR